MVVGQLGALGVPAAHHVTAGRCTEQEAAIIPLQVAVVVTAQAPISNTHPATLSLA